MIERSTVCSTKEWKWIITSISIWWSIERWSPLSRMDGPPSMRMRMRTNSPHLLSNVNYLNILNFRKASPSEFSEYSEINQCPSSTINRIFRIFARLRLQKILNILKLINVPLQQLTEFSEFSEGEALRIFRKFWLPISPKKIISKFSENFF